MKNRHGQYYRCAGCRRVERTIQREEHTHRVIVPFLWPRARSRQQANLRSTATTTAGGIDRTEYAHMDCASREQGLGGTHVMRGRSHMAVDPRTPTTPGRSTSGFHRPGRHCFQQSGSAVRSSASRMKGELHHTCLLYTSPSPRDS